MHFLIGFRDRYNGGMNVVAIESSSEMLSVALSRNGELFVRDIPDCAQRNAELALPTLHTLLAEAGLMMRDIDLVAYGQGPGSFTGVRVACGLAQGLAYGLGVRVIAVPSLQLLAHQAFSNTNVSACIVAVDARMGEVYFAAYQKQSTMVADNVAIMSPALYKPEQIPELPTSLQSDSLCFIGSGFDAITTRDALCDAIAQKCSFSDAELQSRIMMGATPSAAALIDIATHQYCLHGEAATISSADAAPIYLRNRVAMTIDERKQFHANKNVSVTAAI